MKKIINYLAIIPIFGTVILFLWLFIKMAKQKINKNAVYGKCNHQVSYDFSGNPCPVSHIGFTVIFFHYGLNLTVYIAVFIKG